jgi:hypothetical protein
VGFVEGLLEGGVACCALAAAMPNRPMAINAVELFMGEFCDGLKGEEVGVAEICGGVCLTEFDVAAWQ